MLKEWETFYLMIGSAGAGLIGLLFVVVTLTAGFPAAQSSRGTRLYMTPTVLHFAVVFAASAIAIAPGLPEGLTAAVIALAAVVGIAEAVRSSLGIRRPPPAGIDAPHWTDFWMYGVLPGAICVGIVVASVPLGMGVDAAVPAIGALLLGLLLVGIRNAWDLLTWIAPRSRELGQSPPS